MPAACLWDRWTRPDERELYSFAAITYEPPRGAAGTGHQNCVIALSQGNAAEWLSAPTTPPERLSGILSDPQRCYYEHKLAAGKIA